MENIYNNETESLDLSVLISSIQDLYHALDRIGDKLEYIERAIDRN